MPANKQRLVTAVQRASARIEKRPARAAQAVQFIPILPRYHDAAFRVSCWCERDQFLSSCLDTRDLARMISWFNDHARCRPKEPTA